MLRQITSSLWNDRHLNSTLSKKVHRDNSRQKIAYLIDDIGMELCLTHSVSQGGPRESPMFEQNLTREIVNYMRERYFIHSELQPFVEKIHRKLMFTCMRIRNYIYKIVYTMK